MHKVKKNKDLESFGQKHAYFNFFSMAIIKNYKVKKIFNKFPEISGKIKINFRKFSEGTHNPSCDVRCSTSSQPDKTCMCVCVSVNVAPARHPAGAERLQSCLCSVER